MMTRKNILVTGAGGFIGYQLCDSLVGLGHDVIGIDLKYPANLGPPSFDAQICDYRDLSKMETLLRNTDVVLHLACAHLEINLNETEYWDVNVHSIPKFLQQIQDSGVQKLIHVSSVGVYGNLQTYPADEETPCHPQSIYGETKLAGEVEVRKFSEKIGLPTVILRPTWVFGATCPRMRKLYRTLKNRTFTMVGKGKNLRHPIYISDLLQAFRIVMENDQALGESFIVGGSRALSTKNVIQEVCLVFGLKEPLFKIPSTVGKAIVQATETGFRLFSLEPPISKRSLEFFHTNNAFDTTKTKRVLNFEPSFSFKQGLYDCRERLEKLCEKSNGKMPG